jgi:hypothetical protein
VRHHETLRAGIRLHHKWIQFTENIQEKSLTHGIKQELDINPIEDPDKHSRVLEKNVYIWWVVFFASALPLSYIPRLTLS